MINELGLIDLHLHRRNTWSNERENPSFVRLDRFHCPVKCTCSSFIALPNTFKFENYWLKLEEFDHLILTTWANMPLAIAPQELTKKLTKVRQEIRIWRDNKIENITSQKEVCKEILTWLDVTSESRNLNALEKLLKRLIRQRFHQISTIEEIMWKQRAKRQWVQAEDKNSRFFHAVASVQRKNNWIHTLQDEGQDYVKHHEKARVFQYFCSLMGTEWRTEF